MQQLDEWIEQPLTPERIALIQAVVTEGTLDDPGDVGRFRVDDDIHIVDATTGDSVFVPPPAAQLAERASACASSPTRRTATGRSCIP